MGPNIEVISYRFKTASAITGFQQPLNHREWEYFQPFSAHGPCLFPACLCVISLGRDRGLCWDCPGSVVSMAFVCGCPGRQSWASSLVPALLPCTLAVTLQQQSWGNTGTVSIPPNPFWDSLIFHGQDHQYQNLGAGRRRCWIYHSKSGFGLFCLIFRGGCAHFWNRFCFESCDLSGTPQPGATGGPNAVCAGCLAVEQQEQELSVSHLFAGWEEYL